MKFVTSAPHTIGTLSNDSKLMDSHSVDNSRCHDTCVLALAMAWLKTILEDELYYTVTVICVCGVAFGIGMLTALIL